MRAAPGGAPHSKPSFFHCADTTCSAPTQQIGPGAIQVEIHLDHFSPTQTNRFTFKIHWIQINNSKNKAPYVAPFAQSFFLYLHSDINLQALFQKSIPWGILP